MSFLTPLFLVGGLAIALPVVFHLIRRTTRERTRFSSLMFLDPTPPRLTKKSRLEDLLLLLLRCLALGLLAFGFARPFFPEPEAAKAPSTTGLPRVVLLDTSASMRRSGLWSAARERTEALIREAGPEDAVALFTFDRSVTPRITFEEWSSTAPGERGALVAQRLAGVTPGWSATQLGAALARASEALVERESGKTLERGRIVVVSDLQEGSRLETLQSYEWPKGIQVVPSGVRATPPGNATLQRVGEAAGGAAVGDDVLRVRVNNAPDSRQEKFQVGWASSDGGSIEGTPVEVYVPPGQSRLAVLPQPSTNSHPDRVVLRGDSEPFDNTVYVTPPAVSRSRILYLGSDPASDPRQPLYFLSRALPATRRVGVDLDQRSPSAPPVGAECEAARMFVVTEPVSEVVAGALRSQVESGKTVLAVPRNAAAAASLAPVLGIPSLGVEEGRPENYAMMAEIDFRNPLFAPFADARFNDFTRLHFWRYRRIDPAGIPGARVVARFDRGDPALVEVPVGKGRVVILLSGWNPEDSQFALSTKFVPWVVSLLEVAGGVETSRAAFLVGDDIPLSAWGSDVSGPAEVVGPGGRRFAVAAGASSFSDALEPGTYTVTVGGKDRQVVVNVDPVEGRTAPLAVDELERLGAPTAPMASTTGSGPVTPPKTGTRLDSIAEEGRQKLWRWFLVATLFLVFVESGLAGRLARRVASAPQSA
ncbi:MAG: BatA domain-containing protein [Verrucomicrobiota bacterium]